MKKWFYTLPMKLFALLLASLCLFCTALSAIGIAALLQTDGYRDDGKTMTESVLERRFSYVPYEIAEVYCEEFDYLDSYLADLSREIECEYEILCNGSIQGNRSNRDYAAFVNETIYLAPSTLNETVMRVQVRLYFFEPAEGSDLELMLRMMLFLEEIRFGLIAICASCAVGFILLLIFLCFSAGKKGEGEAKFNFFHRVPLEIYLLGAAIVLFLELTFLDVTAFSLFFVLLFGLPILLADALLLLIFVMTFAVRCKRKRLWDTTLTGKLLRLIRLCWQELKLAPQVAIVMVCLGVLDFFLAAEMGFHGAMLVFLIEGIALTVVLLWYAASVQRLKDNAKEIASGNLSARCDLTRLPPGLRSLGEKMNSGAEGMEKAVEEKMKSERFKTELITNVSHDIKTPLTSIVNFVDLMKKEEIENEKVREYLDVLDRQSARLKKLTEDLVESAKAASGALSVELARCDAGVLLEQATGEYQAQLEEKGLIPCVSIPAQPCYIMADGKRLWRVMDNLFQNIVKYALPGTRVYISIEEREGKADLVFRNISAEPISLSGEHLTERFVRGDLSRTTEGSGLGLSIARSLTELQNGVLTLNVDGDLFKATLTFDRV